MERAKKILLSLIAGVLLLQGIGQAQINYPNFGSISGLNLVGDAAQYSNRLRLTPAATWKKGAAWFGTKQYVSDGFETNFQFQLTNAEADGFALVIQNASSSALGSSGRGIGYGEVQFPTRTEPGIENSLAVEFDIWDNTPWSDFVAPHLSVQTRGTSPNSSNHNYSLGATSVVPNFKDGNVHTAKIRYEPGTIDIWGL